MTKTCVKGLGMMTSAVEIGMTAARLPPPVENVDPHAT
jgi:hypothetical protein